MNDFLWRRLVEDLIALHPVWQQHVIAERIRSTVEGYRDALRAYPLPDGMTNRGRLRHLEQSLACEFCGCFHDPVYSDCERG